MVLSTVLGSGRLKAEEPDELELSGSAESLPMPSVGVVEASPWVLLGPVMAPAIRLRILRPRFPRAEVVLTPTLLLVSLPGPSDGCGGRWTGAGVLVMTVESASTGTAGVETLPPTANAPLCSSSGVHWMCGSRDLVTRIRLMVNFDVGRSEVRN